MRVAVITFEADPFARSYVVDTGLAWPLLVDRERRLYRAYDMQRASLWDLFGPRSLWAYLRNMAHGRRPRMATDDVHQRGGDVLVDPEGIVRLHHVGDGPADRPPAERLLAVVRGCV